MNESDINITDVLRIAFSVEYVMHLFGCDFQLNILCVENNK